MFISPQQSKTENFFSLVITENIPFLAAEDDTLFICLFSFCISFVKVDFITDPELKASIQL